MKVTITPATAEVFQDLAGWRYPPPYDFYDGDVEPVLNPERFYGAHDEHGALVGFFYFEAKDGGAVEIGLGLRPELVGGGRGLEFFRRGVDFAHDTFAPMRLVLNVAAFNERAITVYERGGFRRTGEHVRRFDRFGEVPFVEMEES